MIVYSDYQDAFLHVLHGIIVREVICSIDTLKTFLTRVFLFQKSFSVLFDLDTILKGVIVQLKWKHIRLQRLESEAREFLTATPRLKGSEGSVIHEELHSAFFKSIICSPPEKNKFDLSGRVAPPLMCPS